MLQWVVLLPYAFKDGGPCPPILDAWSLSPPCICLTCLLQSKDILCVCALWWSLWQPCGICCRGWTPGEQAGRWMNEEKLVQTYFSMPRESHLLQSSFDSRFVTLALNTHDGSICRTAWGREVRGHGHRDVDPTAGSGKAARRSGTHAPPHPESRNPSKSVRHVHAWKVTREQKGQVPLRQRGGEWRLVRWGSRDDALFLWKVSGECRPEIPPPSPPPTGERGRWGGHSADSAGLGLPDPKVTGSNTEVRMRIITW